MEHTGGLRQQVAWVFGVVNFIGETNPRLAALTQARLDQLPVDFSTKGGMLRWFLDSKHIVMDAVQHWYRLEFSEEMPADWLESKVPAN